MQENIKELHRQLLSYITEDKSNNAELTKIRKHLQNNGVDIADPSEVSKFLGGKLEGGLIEMIKDFLKIYL